MGVSGNRTVNYFSELLTNVKKVEEFTALVRNKYPKSLDYIYLVIDKEDDEISKNTLGQGFSNNQQSCTDHDVDISNNDKLSSYTDILNRSRPPD